MRRAPEFLLEGLMYLAFSVAALPFAWIALHNLLYYRAHPERLTERDSAPEVFGVLATIDLMIYPLMLAAVIALYFLVKGPRAVRISSATLVITWLLPFLVIPDTPFRSFARLYWDALPLVVLTALPWVFAAVRLAVRNENTSTVTT